MSLLPKWLVLCAAAAPLCVAATEHALLNLIRHGERFADKSITHLAPAGYDRAQYIAHCVSPSAPTLAFPKGPPSHLLAAKRQTIHGHNSTRPKETLEPLAKALKIPLDNEIDFEDIDAFARYVQAVPHGSSVFIAWEHKLIGRLAQMLLDPHDPQEPRATGGRQTDRVMERVCFFSGSSTRIP
ncbi:unnamed protein product [Durusdinium trenchii]|uniref:Uncharacterized protein n=1 Tax=Durusdinium trenchii TaxID=1381693 RepID=A0ABP0KJD3_9DINO